MGEFATQVKSLLWKDLLTKRRRKQSLCCDFVCPLFGAFICVIAFFFASDKTYVVSPVTFRADSTVLLDTTGQGNPADPFPSVCGASVSSTRLPESEEIQQLGMYMFGVSSHLGLVFSDVYHFPDVEATEARKKFAVGPPGDIATKLKEYFASRVAARYAASGDPVQLYSVMDGCLRTSTACFDSESAMIGCLSSCPTFIATDMPMIGACSRRLDLDNESSVAERNQTKGAPLRHLATTRCTDLKKACDCAQNPECGWLEQMQAGGFNGSEGTCREKTTAGGLYRGGVSCAACDETRIDEVPDGCSLQNVWTKVGERVQLLMPAIETVQNNDDLDAKAAKDEKYCGGVLFESSNAADIGSEVRYTLRPAASTEEEQQRNPQAATTKPVASLKPNFFDFFSRSGPNLHLQRAVDDFITCDNATSCLNLSEYKFPPGADGIQARVSSFPIPSERDNGVLMAVYRGVPTILQWVLITLSLVWTVHMLREKEWKVKDAMQAHGVKLSAFYTEISLFMFLWSLLCSIIPALILAFIPKAAGDHGFDTSFGTFYVVIWLSLWNSYALVAFVTTFFTQTFPPTYFVFGIFQIVQYVLNELSKDSQSRGIIRLATLHPILNIIRAASVMEQTDLSLNANDFSVEHFYYCLNDSVMMNCIAIVLWHVLFFYFDVLLQDGSSHRWYYPFTSSFWRPVDGLEPVLPSEDVLRRSGSKLQPPTGREMDAEAAQRVIHISNLTKRYGNFTAVNSVNASMYAGEIFALLGHNGAGKTTTFSMLSGMNAVTEGSIRVFGRSLHEHLKTQRHKVGLCTQQNLVWPILSVNEHLRLFSSFKGIKMEKKEADEDIDSLLAMLSLSDKKYALASTLSGGMVRKLCLAMSLLGDPDLLLLDEPTSGLDPTARREVWDLLLSRKHNRVVILSTHYMEEADALGDRVAIMNDGRIECSGSPAFLKEKYGCGYNLTCLMQAGEASEKDGKRAVRDLVYKYCNPEDASEQEPVQILTNVGREMTLLLRFTAAKHFPSLFAALDQHEGVESFSVGVSNLEEVFLKVASHHDSDMVTGTSAFAANNSEVMESIARKAGDMAGIGGVAAGRATFVNQLRACVTKRLFFSRRKWNIDFCTVCLPMLFVLLAIILSAVSANAASSVSLAIPPSSSGAGYAAEDSHLYTPSAPSVIASGFLTNPTALSQRDATTTSILDAAAQFDSTIPLWALNTATPCTTQNASACVVFKNKCPTPDVERHDTNGDYITPLLVSDDEKSLRYAAFIFPETAVNGSVLPVSILANLRATEAPGMAVNRFSNMLLAANGKAGRIRASTLGIPLSDGQTSRYVAASTAALVPGFILNGVGIAAVIFTTLILIEKDLGILTQQISVGLRAGPYWISNWIVDSCAHLLAMVLVFIVLAIDDVTSYVGGEFSQWAYVILLFLLFALAQPLYCYVVCAIFKTSNASSMMLFFGNVLFAQILLALGSFFDLLLSTSGADSAEAPWHTFVVTLLWISRLSPSFAMANGLSDLDYLIGNFWKTFPLEDLDAEYFASCTSDVAIKKRYSLQCATSIWDVQYGPGRNLVMLVATLFLWPLVIVALTVVRNSKWWKQYSEAKHPPLEQDWDKMKDDDVRAEEERVAAVVKENTDNPDTAILAHRVRKVFEVAKGNKAVHAVQGVSFTADLGEVFGLLGVNGAGKSTTFKMLAGELLPMAEPSTGSLLRVQRQGGVGYCPQHDPLWSVLTPREHLTFTAQVKGIAPQEIPQVVTDLMRAVDLSAYAEVQSQRLSGGNKRKLCVAMSLVGTPKILFLDEPSAGVDPLSRRFMWGVIQQVAERDKNTTVVLTTHSMEECEALCTRTAIMVNGVFRCIGPNTRIRNVYGGGSTLDVSFSMAGLEAIQEKLVAEWRVSPDATVVTYGQLQSACTSGMHKECLHSSASCFPTLVNFVAEKKKLDELGESDKARLEASAVPTRAATQWWHSVTLCEAFVSKLRTRMSEIGIDVVDGAIAFEEIHGEKVRLLLQTGGAKSLNELFKVMEDFKRNRDVEDYTLSRASLESIFNRFAREPLNNIGEGNSCC